MQVAELLEILVQINEAGALHHEGIELLDGCVGVACLAVALGLRIDNAVQSFGEKNEGTNDKTGVGILFLNIVTNEHAQGQDDTGTGTTGSGGSNDNTHCLLHIFAGLAEKIIDGIIERTDLTGLDGGVQSKTGDSTNLTRAFGYGLIIHNRVLGEPLFACFLIIVQIAADSLGVGGLYPVDFVLAACNVGKVVDVGIQAKEVDIFFLLGSAKVTNLLDDLASGTADAHEQSGSRNLIGLQFLGFDFHASFSFFF